MYTSVLGHVTGKHHQIETKSTIDRRKWEKKHGGRLKVKCKKTCHATMTKHIEPRESTKYYNKIQTSGKIANDFSLIIDF